ncbi:MAG: hypothetical protein H7239_06130 [Flavobacterium sp.]|nr:hypothetical protein [Flavobacterium sp.]
MAIFKFTNSNSNINYQLYVDAKNVNQFPLIVNDCRISKENEFQFDKINLKKLFEQNK